MSAAPPARSPRFTLPRARTALIIAVSNGTGEDSASASSQYCRPASASPRRICVDPVRKRPTTLSRRSRSVRPWASPCWQQARLRSQSPIALNAMLSPHSVRLAHQRFPCPLEDRERAGPGLHGAVKVAGDDAHVRERALGERRILLEPARLRDLERPATVAHRDFRRAAGEAVEVAGPAVPGGAAARIVEGLDQLADLLERLDVLGVTPERELDLRLLDDRVDTPPSVRLGVRQRFEPRESPLE